MPEILTGPILPNLHRLVPARTLMIDKVHKQAQRKAHNIQYQEKQYIEETVLIEHIFYPEDIIGSGHLRLIGGCHRIHLIRLVSHKHEAII